MEVSILLETEDSGGEKKSVQHNPCIYLHICLFFYGLFSDVVHNSDWNQLRKQGLPIF